MRHMTHSDAPIPTNSAADHVTVAVDSVATLRDHPTASRPKSLAAATEALQPLAVGREQAAALFSISRATFDRWDASGQLGPVGIRKNGRKLWLLVELREWAAAGMPPRKEWLARRAAQVNGQG